MPTEVLGTSWLVLRMTSKEDAGGRVTPVRAAAQPSQSSGSDSAYTSGLGRPPGAALRSPTVCGQPQTAHNGGNGPCVELAD